MLDAQGRRVNASDAGLQDCPKSTCGPRCARCCCARWFFFNGFQWFSSRTVTAPGLRTRGTAFASRLIYQLQRLFLWVRVAWPCADGRHAAGAGIAPSKAQVNTVSTRGPDCFDWFSWPQAGGRFGASAGWAAGPDGVCLRHHRPVHYLRAPFPSRSSSLHAECPTTEEGRVGSGKGRKALP